MERLESYSPPWPLPKIFRLTKAGKLIEGIFKGSTINTPSLLCVEDVLDSLRWAESIGGLSALISRSENNLDAVTKWVEASDWAGFLAEDPATRSPTSICLEITDEWFRRQPGEDQSKLAKSVVARLDEEGVAHDIGAYRDAPTGFRIWGGATVERDDLEALLPWLDWAYGELKENVGS